MTDALPPDIQQAIAEGAEVVRPDSTQKREYLFNTPAPQFHEPPTYVTTPADPIGQKMAELGRMVRPVLHVEGMEPIPIAANPVTVLDQINVRRLMLHVGKEIRESLTRHMGFPATDAELQEFHAFVTSETERLRPMLEAAGVRITSIDTYREPSGESGVKIASTITPTAPAEFISVSFKMRPLFTHLPRRLRKRALAEMVAGMAPKDET